MKIVFFGDSITDMGRDRSTDFGAGSYGYGYTNIITAELTKEQSRNELLAKKRHRRFYTRFLFIKTAPPICKR